MPRSNPLTDAQQAANHLLAGPQRHTLLVGGARSGKTFLLTRALVMRGLRAAGSRHIALRFRYNAIKQSIWLDTLPKVVRTCFPGVAIEHKKQDGYVVLPNKSEIWFGGLDDDERVEKILGMEFATVYFNECSQIPYSSVLVALTRLAQQVPGLRNRAYYDMNPTGTGHWTYRQFVEKVDPVSRVSLGEPDNYAHQYLNPYQNAANIDPEYIKSLEALPDRQRKRFLEGRYVAEIDGALWSHEILERNRVWPKDVPPLRRIVVAVDPSGASGEEDVRSDEIGIVVCGVAADGTGYVLADMSGRMAPEAWARTAVDAYRRHKADRIVVEKNFGGDMARAVLQGVDNKVPVSFVVASRGKIVRAEPVAALFEQNKVRVAGRFERLEDQLLNFSTAGYLGDRSPDRADAMVWGLSSLMLFGQSAVLQAPIIGVSPKPDFGSYAHV